MTTSLTFRMSGKDWSREKARHLLNRAGFGVPASLIDKFHDQGLRESVDYLLRPNSNGHSDKVDFVEMPVDDRAIREKYKDLEPEERRKKVNEQRKKERESVEKLKFWWLEQSLRPDCPLQEKMSQFWHGHFATSAQKVKQAYYNYQLNEVFRGYGLGNFRELVVRVSQSPAMLQYLDNRQNRKGHPNENFARELMELFTLGIGNYTEQDIQESARAFTGWTIRDHEFQEVPRMHDTGMKQFLDRTGEFNGYDIIDIICSQPAMSEFIPKKLWEYFVYEAPDAQTVRHLGNIFRENNLELRPVLRTIFESREFYSERAMHRQIKSPVQLIVGLMDHLNVKPDQIRQKLLTQAMRGMGQELFYPPNVKGWPGNRHWINSNTLLTRYNLPAYVLYGDGNNGRKDKKAAEKARRKKAPFKAEAFLERFAGKPAGQTVDELCDYFLGRKLVQSQRKVLLQAIDPDGSESLGLPESSKSAERLVGVIHLILSTAEYQLC